MSRRIHGIQPVKHDDGQFGGIDWPAQCRYSYARGW